MTDNKMTKRKKDESTNNS